MWLNAHDPNYEYNFVFNDEHFIQRHGTAMGTSMAPAFANLLWESLKGKHLTVMGRGPFSGLDT